MPRFNVEVRVMPRDTLLDPQGQAVENALKELEFSGLSGVRVGRALTFALESRDRASAESEVREMCVKLLANPVTEDFTLTATEA
jgi:phosphoribosylformylglycinamidine synthase